MHYYEQNRDMLAGQYGQSWIAIYEGRVVASELDPLDLLDSLKSMNETDGLPFERTVLRHAGYH